MGVYCGIKECKKAPHARGWCAMHYQRWRKYGNPLAGSTFFGEPMRFLMDTVLPFSGDKCLLWPYGRGKSPGERYGQIWHNGKVQGVHRVVCEKVHGAPPSPKHEAAHTCGRGAEGCVNPTHLRWATSKENKADQIAHGTIAHGKRNGNAKLTEAEVLAIRNLKGTMSQSKIAVRFGICQAQVHRIHSGHSWNRLLGKLG